ncbi:MAG: polysaccharide biosynthesis/export family protein [Desulfobacterales bacterium]|jgi:polysaccharide export outer membrane protein
MTLKLKKPYRFICTLTAAGIFASLSILTGCVSRPNAGQTLPPAELKQDEIAQFNEQLFASARMNTDPSDYLLGSGDLLQIKVYEAEDLNTTVRVSSRGYVTLPLLGAVSVNGLSAREAEETIENLYRAQYIKDPHVSIFVEEHFSRRITLMGQFRNPGTYDYLAKQRLLDVMALGGGLGDKAGRVIQVRRYSGSQEGQRVFVVDLDQLIKEGKSDLNIEINSGDVLFVPEAGTFFVDGAVRRPGAYHIKHTTTIQEALLEAGGLAPYADKKRATLIRYTEKGERQMIKLDLSLPESQELEVRDRDVLITEASTYGKLVHGFGLQIGVPGFGSLGYRNPETRW